MISVWANRILLVDAICFLCVRACECIDYFPRVFCVVSSNDMSIYFNKSDCPSGSTANCIGQLVLQPTSDHDRYHMPMLHIPKKNIENKLKKTEWICLLIYC